MVEVSLASERGAAALSSMNNELVAIIRRDTCLSDALGIHMSAHLAGMVGNDRLCLVRYRTIAQFVNCPATVACVADIIII